MKLYAHNPRSVRAAALASESSGAGAAGSLVLSANSEARLWPVLPPLSACGITALPIAAKAAPKAGSNAKRSFSKKQQRAGGND